MLVQQGASAYCLGRWATQVRQAAPECRRCIQQTAPFLAEPPDL
jgi:hypothetical protein